MAFQRNTRQRKVILEELQKLTSHPTATDLYEHVRCSLPKISLGTVYRNLELLSQMGLIQKLEISGDQARFDGNPLRHCHVRCVHCGKVNDVHYEPTGLLDIKVTSLNGYKIVGQRLEFLGICPECMNEQQRTDVI